jgi:hypothetical protein
MAKFELKFLDSTNSQDFIKVEKCEHLNNTIEITGVQSGDSFCIYLDKSTAIKFAKTLRTEINKITESEV